MLSALLVGNFLSASSGTRGVCEDLAARLSQAGWSIYTTSAMLGRLSRLADMVSTTWCYRKRYQVAQVDVYSGQAFVWAEIVCWLLQRLNRPYALTLHGGNLPTFAKQWPGRVHRLLQTAAIVTTPSAYLFNHMQSYRRDLRLLPNPLDIRCYPFELRQRPQPRLMWLRAFHTVYNPSLAAKVVALLRDEFPAIQLTMVGPDKGDGSFQELQHLVQDLGLGERLAFPGSVPKTEVPRWLNQGDIFINTTNVDNTPVSVLEAMACGLSVVSTNVGGIPYLLEHEQDALLVPPNDPAAMAAAVRRILTEPGLAQHLSQNARKKAEQFDWAVILPQWEALLTSVAQGG